MDQRKADAIVAYAQCKVAYRVVLDVQDAIGDLAHHTPTAESAHDQIGEIVCQLDALRKTLMALAAT